MCVCVKDAKRGLKLWILDPGACFTLQAAPGLLVDGGSHMTLWRCLLCPCLIEQGPTFQTNQVSLHWTSCLDGRRTCWAFILGVPGSSAASLYDVQRRGGGTCVFCRCECSTLGGGGPAIRPGGGRARSASSRHTVGADVRPIPRRDTPFRSVVFSVFQFCCRQKKVNR